MKNVLIFICVLASLSFDAIANKSSDYSIFIHHDTNESDSYSSIGVEVIHRQRNSYLGVAVNSSFGYAHVTDTYNYQHNFIAWEGGIKLGYFSDFSLYLELGVDLAELTLNDRSDDDYPHNKIFNTDFENDNFNHRDQGNDTDGYVGIGSSFIIERIKITGFIRFREISGYNWQAKNNTFTGIELALVF
jgi:hypothetical protein